MTDREAFEAWIVEASASKVMNLELIGTGSPFAGQYRNITIQCRWEAWQAAAAAERDAPEVEELKAQRDELLTSLKELLSELEYGHACPLTKEKSSAAIAKAEGADAIRKGSE